ncbi:hypothetical protein [Teichococcus aestuarii]|uniref:hypothetical protein n=1 Tax=Teichococcus aestuarii TaxID=568898 RepID=UPI0036072996
MAGGTVLLPALDGFEAADHVVLNPSYYAFPILGVLARAVPDPAWLRRRRTGWPCSAAPASAAGACRRTG